jgi:hypothetical protein
MMTSFFVEDAAASVVATAPWCVRGGDALGTPQWYGTGAGYTMPLGVTASVTIS